MDLGNVTGLEFPTLGAETISPTLKTTGERLGRKPKPKPEGQEGHPLSEVAITTTKVNQELIRLANMVVLHRKKKDPNYTLYQYLEEILGPAIRDHWRKMIAEDDFRKV